MLLNRKEVENPKEYFDKSFAEYKEGFHSGGKCSTQDFRKIFRFSDFLKFLENFQIFGILLNFWKIFRFLKNKIQILGKFSEFRIF